MNSAGELQELTFTVNGTAFGTQVQPFRTLQACLHHQLGFTDVRHGCGEGVCGACTVLVDGEPMASCLMLALQANGRSIITAAGLEHHFASLGISANALRAHLIERQAFQCGYCSCGVLVSAAHYLSTAPRDATPESVGTALSGHLCRCTGYRQMIEATLAANHGQPVPVSPFPRPDLQEKLSGSASYPTDRKVDKPLVGRILWSEWPSARIISIDTSEAILIPGVEVILTYRDVPADNFTGSTLFRKDQPLLVRKDTRSLADAVALVAAQDEAAACEAVQRIRVTYETHVPVTDIFESIKPRSLGIGHGSNVIAQVVEASGDPAAAFRTADMVIKGDYSTMINDHGVMEEEGGTGWWEGDVLVLAIPHQTPATGQRNVARMLGISEQRVRIVAPRMGGSFGKYMVATIEGYLALLVFKTKKPVRLVLERGEMLRRRSKRHPSFGHYELAVARDGRFLALKADVLTDAGAYVSLTPAVAAVISTEATGAYEIPNVFVRTRGVLTNNLVTAPMRGYGSQQISFGVESIVEKAARALSMEPGELRRRNYKKVRTDGRGLPVPGANLELTKTIDRVEALLGAPPACPSKWLLGRGFASIHSKYGFPYGFVDRFAVRLSVDQNGRFSVESDISDSGTAVPAEMTRLVAEALGLHSLPEYVQDRSAVDDPSGTTFSRGGPASALRLGMYRFIEWAQTGSGRLLLFFTSNMEPRKLTRLMRFIARPVNFLMKLVNGIKTLVFPYNRDSFQPRFASSRAASLCAHAVLRATERMKNTAISLAADMLAVSAEDLYADAEGVRHNADETRSLTWSQLAKHAGGKLTALAEAHNPAGQMFDPATGNQRGPVDFMDASHGCYLAVHPGTGEVRILKYVACHDLGHVFNREAARGQILGGIAMGMGQTLSEKLQLRAGRILNTGFHDYLVPTALEMPLDLQVEILESGNGIGPQGSKGVGESGAVAAPIAIANALYDALGSQVTSIPATPEDLVRLIAKEKSK